MLYANVTDEVVRWRSKLGVSPANLLNQPRYSISYVNKSRIVSAAVLKKSNRRIDDTVNKANVLINPTLHANAHYPPAFSSPILLVARLLPLPPAIVFVAL